MYVLYVTFDVCQLKLSKVTIKKCLFMKGNAKRYVRNWTWPIEQDQCSADIGIMFMSTIPNADMIHRRLGFMSWFDTNSSWSGVFWVLIMISHRANRTHYIHTHPINSTI